MPYLDAANIDLKTMSESACLANCGVHVDPVLATLRTLAKSNVVLEVTNLVIPGFNDSDADIAACCAFVADELGKDVPVHFSRFFPRHRMTDRPPTPLETLRRADEIARAHGLHYVYRGNVEDEANTMCPSCGRCLIRRSGFDILSNVVVHDRCPDCGHVIYGRF